MSKPLLSFLVFIVLTFVTACDRGRERTNVVTGDGQPDNDGFLGAVLARSLALLRAHRAPVGARTRGTSQARRLPAARPAATPYVGRRAGSSSMGRCHFEAGADTMIGTQAFLDMRDNHALLFTTHIRRSDLRC
jgi:hypothetical protein